ncbi:MAG: 50S ribosomal protein L15 [Bryobacterales bacterium]|nr:50S ribosomal protein L15 [Bryobacterales bacterium]
MDLSNLKPPAGQTKPRKRVGRGMGSGHGKTSTRGTKGQSSISGFSQKRGFEGGRMPLHRRLPKRGFTNIFRTEYAVLNISRLNDLEGSEFSPESLMAAGVIRNLRDGLKILGSGDLTRAISVTAHAFTKQAAEKIAAAGGKANTIAPKAAPKGKLAPKSKEVKA